VIFIEKKHVWECAKAKIEVDEAGRITDVQDPLLDYCPLREYSGFHSKVLNKEDIRQSMQWRIDTLGLCKSNRVLITKLAGVGYGASECLMTGLDANLLDAAVVACEGAGTVISNDKFLIQGIGIAMSALVSTFPMSDILLRLRKLGAYVLDTRTAKIDQVAGVRAAIKKGFKKIGVTVAGLSYKDVEILRQIEKETKIQILIILVHTSGVPSEAEPFIIRADIVQSCASKIIRDSLDSKKVHIGKFGSIIPIYAFTEFGNTILKLREKEMQKNAPIYVIGGKVSKNAPNPLI
jgi:putative methanogenesis marker protein 8